MGRKKLINERFQIRCHPKVIADVRAYAKTRTIEELKKEQTKK